MKTIAVFAVAICCVFATNGFTAEKPDESLSAEIKGAREFLATFNQMPRALEAEKAITSLVKVGDSVLQHRALLSEAMRVRLNPYSGLFAFTYEQGGKPHDGGDQGFWVAHIESDQNSKIVQVRVGVAKQ